MSEIEQGEHLLSRVDATASLLNQVIKALDNILLGNRPITTGLLTGILAGGHVLLEGLPGLGKTELVKGFAQLCSVHFKRVQFTPDLLPSDITGSFILQSGEENHGSRSFIFQQGPIFTNILLCDEINRASPKTQSALLEAMAERHVTVMGETHPLPKPFFVIATQNPIELEGTYPLPEAQVDRFIFKLHLKRPASEVIKNIVKNRINGTPPQQTAILNMEQLTEAIQLCSQIHVSDPVAIYISRLIEATHPDSYDAPELVKKYVRYGGSPRAAISLAAASKAYALLEGKAHVGFENVRKAYPSIINHRIILDYSAKLDNITHDQVINAILDHISIVEKSLPAGASL